jgi:hypothetical protein
MIQLIEAWAIVQIKENKTCVNLHINQMHQETQKKVKARVKKINF